MGGRCGPQAGADCRRLTLSAGPAKRDQLPLSIGRRWLLSKNVEISVVGQNFVRDAVYAVPLIQNFLNQILSSFQAKSNRAFVGLSSGVALHCQLHEFHYRRDESKSHSTRLEFSARRSKREKQDARPSSDLRWQRRRAG